MESPVKEVTKVDNYVAPPIMRTDSHRTLLRTGAMNDPPPIPKTPDRRPTRNAGALTTRQRVGDDESSWRCSWLDVTRSGTVFAVSVGTEPGEVERLKSRLLRRTRHRN